MNYIHLKNVGNQAIIVILQALKVQGKNSLRSFFEKLNHCPAVKSKFQLPLLNCSKARIMGVFARVS